MTRYLLIISVLLFSGLYASAQNPGDTIKVRTFHYGSNNRDTVAVFPSGNLTYEKIIMKYSMRCKNGLISNGTDRNLGCGEWDYSCNTYIVDSSKIEEANSTQAKYVISNFTGSSFPYTAKSVYDYWDFTRNFTVVDSVKNDSQFITGLNQSSIANDRALNAKQKSGKSQYIYTVTELNAAGLQAGYLKSIYFPIQGFGAKVSFLKIKLAHGNDSLLKIGRLTETGFTTVFDGDVTFVSGLNRLVFNTPFYWNGTDHLLVEYSYTNSVGSDSTLLIESYATPYISGIIANNGYAVELGNNGHIRIDTAGFSTIKNEMTIAFWAFGNATQLPPSNSILYGTDQNINNRHLNIHLPHSSNNVFFDCGFSAGGYDRINKIATPQEQGGRWNHWVFTKNAVAGTLKIYLNGQLWHSGTGKTKPLNITQLILGKDITLSAASNYKGKVSNLCIWNKELTDSMIRLVRYAPMWFMNGAPVAHYYLNEGSGQTVKETFSSFNNSNGTNLQWSFERGDKLFKDFMLVDLKPKFGFGTGDYYIHTQQVTVRDSVKRMPNTVDEYNIISKAGVTPMTNDVVNLANTYTNLTHAVASKIYNGNADTMQLIDSIPVASEGVYTMTNLNFIRRFPFYNEIMSFVTPYGIGLDLGINGKSWYYDVTDFAPLLKNNKRILMTLGGQTQEQNDIEFWFVVGTPPRNVLEFNQIWQATNRTGSASLSSIYNNTRYPATNVPTLATGKAFKLRSSITGHGSEGEFEANGGQVYHMINLNGGDTDLVWTISQQCAYNPVFPQGGTWVYDRQGWCPGQSSLLKEQDITSKVTPGNNVSIDYIASAPPKAGGAYNYQVAHQMVTYGALNFTKDARILEVVQPSDKILYGRNNPVCAQPKIVVQNSGAETITQMEISYWINQSANKLSYTWSGTLPSLESDTLVLPIGNLWNDGMLATGNRFFAEIKTVNGSADAYALNNKFISSFTKPVIVPSVFTLEIRTNNNPTENSFKLLDDQGNVLDSKSFTDANTTFSKQYNLGGCYTLIVEDKGEDGLQWWANSAQGTGFARLKNANNQIIRTFQPDFGGRFEFNFTTNWALTLSEQSFGKNIHLYPNPSKDKFILEGNDLQQAEVSVTDIMGKEILVQTENRGNKIICQTNNLNLGIYLVIIRKGGEQDVKRLVIE